MALGTFILPDVDVAGSADALCKGSGSYGETQGLQAQFADVLQTALDTDIAGNGITITTGYSGYVSNATATEWSNNGNTSFLTNIEYFGWGLAAEVLSIDTSNYQSSSTSTDSSVTIANVLSSYNLEMDSSGDIRFIRPSLITIDESAETISYNGTETTSSDSTSSTTASVSSIAYFFSNQFSSITAQSESYLLTGNRALANDKALWDYVLSAVKQSLRVCASGPNGEFLAWYPDYWGQYENKTPYLDLADIELQDFTITQSDDEFYSHVYCSGVTASGTSVDYYLTQGVVSVESDPSAQASSASISGGSGTYEVSDEVSAILKELIYIPDGDEWKYTPKELYRRYGARPYATTCTTAVEDTSSDYESNPKYILPFLEALYDFMEHWANQYTASLSITFMPELFPGCRINITSLDVSLFVKSVTHRMDYTDGFTTTVECTCPIGTLVSGMVNPS